ncbi:MAG: hypothetical protein ACJA0Q_001433 [Saprospiraceae bacterium]|jgi:hypothetical protein
MKFLKSDTYYFQVYRDKLIVRQIDEQKTIEKVPEKPFSGRRSVLADFLQLETTMRAVLKELQPKRMLCGAPQIVMHVREENFSDISDVERRTLLDSAQHAGAYIVKVFEGDRELTDRQVMELIND